MDKLQTLKTIFGHDSFRDGQEKIIDEILDGYDVFCIMPTGAGKSMCYQIPALMRDGVTLVISPLISLMKDQVMSLKTAGINAAYINSSLTPSQQNEAIRRAGLGMYKIIYVAPERLSVPSFIQFASNVKIGLIAVDEAHCVSQWGHDFRPSYLKISDFIRQLPERPPVAAFTATATEKVGEDIVRLLELVNPYRITTGFNRPNLRFTNVKPTDKYAYLQSFIQENFGQCGIVYCNTRKNVEEITARLQYDGYLATRYHAGLSDQERQKNQEDFQFDRVNIMVATNAFGMGIDKSNVRYVVHYNMPRNLENYYQEAGRAGRDGEESECLLLYSGQDVVTGQWMIEHGDKNPDLNAAQQEALQQAELEKLKAMTWYATSKKCLRGVMLRYFGESASLDGCGNCSVCLDEPFEIDNGKSGKKIPERKIRKAEKKVQRSRPRKPEDYFTSRETIVLENLKLTRQLLARQMKVPAYIIFADSVLVDMVVKNPKTLDALLEVSGVGIVKQQRFGQLFLDVLYRGIEPNEAVQQHFARNAE